MKLNDDIYMLALTMNMNGQSREFNPILILDARHGPTLVDTGLPGQASAIDAALAEAGLRMQDLKRIIITHQDLDHVGSLYDLVRASGARVLAHAIEFAYIDGTRRPIKWTPDLLEQMPQMRALIENWRPAAVDEHLQDGARLDLAGGVRIVFTPGHTPGHISLYLERTKTLLAGDALLADDGRLTGPNPSPLVTPDLALAHQSVRKLAQLDVQTIVCYHGGVIRVDANEQLRRVAQECAPAR
jgi:glyoxylase-like metal-dependent hydrolase (beta-lactamase superfamily II)